MKAKVKSHDELNGKVIIRRELGSLGTGGEDEPSVFWLKDRRVYEKSQIMSSALL